MVEAAEWVAGITLTEAERVRLAEGLARTMQKRASLHEADIGNEVPPAIRFTPMPGQPRPGVGLGTAEPSRGEWPRVRPAADEDLAFLL
jgi:hypothetical protein